MSNIACITLNWNNSMDTIRCIESLKNAYPKEKTILLVDNNSNEEEKKIIRDYLENKKIKNKYTRSINNIKVKIKEYSEFPKLKYLKIEKNTGYAQGNNIAAIIACEKDKPEYLLFINNDATIEKTTITELLNKYKEEKRTGTVSALLINPDKTIQSAGNYLIKKIVQPRITKKIMKKITDYPTGACFIIKTDLFMDIKFYEKYFAYYEDVELGLEIKKRRLKNIICKNAICEHELSKTTKRSNKYYFFMIRNRLIYFYRNVYKNINSEILIYIYILFFRIPLYTIQSKNKIKTLTACFKGFKDGIKKKNHISN